MARRHFPRLAPLPVTSLRVPDVVQDKGVKLSRAQARALKEGQGSLFGYEYERREERQEVT